MDTDQFADGSSLIMGGSRGVKDRGSGPPGKSQKHRFFFSNTGPDPVENIKAAHVPSRHYIGPPANNDPRF